MKKQTDKQLEEEITEMLFRYDVRINDLQDTKKHVKTIIKKSRFGMIKIEDVEKMIDKIEKLHFDEYDGSEWEGYIEIKELKQSLKELGDK
jgi:Ca2+-binding EF-hand superfamily protein